MKLSVMIKAPQGALRKATLEVMPGRLVIGRENADLVVGDAKCSRQHCALYVLSDSEVFLRDLESTNGTFVEGRRVVCESLHVGQSFRIGDTEITLMGNDEGDSAPAYQSPPPRADRTGKMSESERLVAHGSEALFNCLPVDYQKRFSDFKP